MSHAVLAPSKADMWMGCLGSIAFSDGVEASSSIYADEGTAAHAVASELLAFAVVSAMPSLAKLDAAKAHLRTFYKTDDEFKAAMDYVQVYVNYVLNAAEGKILFVEEKVNVERWTTEVGGKGTADAIIIDLDKLEVEIVDLKFGTGVVVEVEGNKQERIYGLGALDFVELVYGPMKTIKTTIVQPRRDSISSAVIDREDLMAFGSHVQYQGGIAISLLKAKKAGKPSAYMNYLTPSVDACRWCPMAATCPARAKMVMTEVFEEFAILDDTGELKCTTKQIEGDTLLTDAVLTMIEDWCKAKREWIDKQLRQGVENPFWKLVRGRKGNRKFSDEEKVIELLKSCKLKDKQIFDTKLKGLPELQKIVPKKRWVVFEDYITQTPAKLVSVPMSHPGEAVKPGIDVLDCENLEVDYEVFT